MRRYASAKSPKASSTNSPTSANDAKLLSSKNSAPSSACASPLSNNSPKSPASAAKPPPNSKPSSKPALPEFAFASYKRIARILNWHTSFGRQFGFSAWERISEEDYVDYQRV